MKIGIIDGAPIFCYGLSQILWHNGFVVSDVRSSTDSVDILLLGNNATGSMKFIHGAMRKSALLLIVDETRPAPLPPDVRSAVHGVINREASPDLLVRAVRVIADGGRFFPGEAGPESEGDDRTASDQLSPREREVLLQIARGFTHGQIARGLGISPHTVDTYVRRIRTKLGVGNKAELTRAALLSDFASIRNAS